MSMAEIYIYRPDCQDFSNIGECGRLCPTRYEWDGAANSLPEIVLEHPLDAMGRYLLLQEDWIIKAPAPVRLMPEIADGGYVTSVEIWTVASTATRAQRYVYSKYNGTGKKKLLKAGWQVVVTAAPAEGRWKIKCGRVAGWIEPEALTGRTEVTIPDTAMGIEDVAPSWESRDQLFRIYSVNKAAGKITVYARAKAGDAAGNITTYDTMGAVTLQQAADGIIGNTLDDCALTVATDITGTRTGVHARDTNPVAALLNPEEGLAARWNAQAVFDDEDIYLLNQAGANRGVRIEYARNLEGVDMDVNVDDVITHVRPVGEYANGTPLYLPDDDGLVACPNAADYSYKRIYVLEVSDAKIGGKGANKVTPAMALERLRTAADNLIATGIDMPSVNAKISQVSLGDAPRFAQYRQLQGVFLYDTVTIYHPRLAINMAAEICRVKWDGLRRRVIDTEIGDMMDMTPKVSSWQISGRINGGKLIPGTVGAGALVEDAINARHIQAESINTDALQANSITAEKLAAGAVYAQALEAVTANIQQLTAGRITTDELYASMAQIVSAQIGEADIDHASIKQLAAQVAEIAEAQIEHADIGTAVIDDAYISTLAAALATIARASIEHADIDDALIDWAGIDNLTAQAAAIAKANVGSVTIASANIDWAAVAALAADVADISQARIDQAEISQATIEQITAEVTDTITLTAQNANFDFASAQRLVASTMILEQGVGGSVTIENLVATSAMFVQATLGKLTLKGDDGKYYDVTVAADGTIHTEDTGYTDADIIDGVAPNGRPVVATEAAIDELNSTNIRAQSAIMTQIFTKALTAETISASEAFLASATIPQLYVTAIAALGDTLDLSANQSIRLAVGDAIVSRQRWYQLQPAGQAAPAKPAVNPPGGAWTDEEPAFESGSRNKFGPNESPAEGAYIDATGAVVAGWTDVSGGDGAVLTMEVSAETAGQYRCIVTDANGDAVTTEAAALAVGTKALPLITAQPQNAFAARNSTVELTVEAENVAGYQWQWKAIDSETWADLSAGNTSYPGGTTKTVSFELTPQRSATSRHYRCVLTNSAGSVITDVVAATIDTGENAYIAAQPRSMAVAQGDTATFSVAAENAAGYMWQTSSDGETWEDCGAALYPDRTTDALAVELTGNDGWQYRCAITGIDGTTIYSDAAALSLAGPLAVTDQPQDQTGETGDTVAFTVAAAGAEPLAYRWQVLSDAAALDWTVSDYIAVEPGTEYYFQPNTEAGSTAKHAFYGEGLDFISAVASGPGAFTTPEGCRFMRFSYLSESDDIQLETGGAPTDWEPYDPERRYVLYFVDLNEYAGGTWEYGDVCVSSGYEAAKAADSAQSAADDNAAGIDTLNGELQAVQDAADAAMSAVRSLAVGGVNLIDDSARITITGTDDPATSYLELASGLLPGTVYTLGMASAVLAAGSAAGMTLEAVRQSDGEILFTDTLDFSGGHQKHTFATGEGDATYALRLYAGIKGASNGVTVELEKVKLEEGTFATMWTESPADAEQKLAALTSQLNLTQGGLEDIVTHVTQDVDGTIQSVNSYFRFDGSDPNNPKLIIGSSVSPMTMELTNSRLSFLWNGDPVAYFSDNKLYVTNVEAIERLSVGTPQNGYMDIVTTATGVGFMWRS